MYNNNNIIILYRRGVNEIQLPSDNYLTLVDLSELRSMDLVYRLYRISKGLTANNNIHIELKPDGFMQIV